MIPQYAEELRYFLRHLASSPEPLPPLDTKGLLAMTDQVLGEFPGLAVQSRVELRNSLSAFFASANNLRTVVERCRLGLFRAEDATSPPEVLRMAAERKAREVGATVEKWTEAPPESRASQTAADVLMKEIRRVRDVVMPRYIEIGAAGAPALVLMRDASDRAIEALAHHDGVECLRLYEVLRGFKV
jgi:hypothetical protein